MDFLLEALTNWLKEMLVGGIMSNLSGMFDSVNQQVADISVQVGQTPQGWNGSIFSMIENLSNSIMVPIAGVILAIVMTVDLIQMIADKNNIQNTVVPTCLEKNADSDDKPRESLDSYKINAIVVLYDIYRKTDSAESYCLYKNVPMGIYFTGSLDENKVMTNTITKYITSETVYNQGTSYGLRICTRFLAQPNCTVTVDSIDAQGSTNVSELTPVLQKMAETLTGVEAVLSERTSTQKLLNDHLANFKNNKVNVPYVRQLGTKKYWFVNGKNTGAVAQYEMSDPNDIIMQVAKLVLELVYSKNEINNILTSYLQIQDLNMRLENLVTTEQLNSAIKDITDKLYTYEQNE